MDTTPVRLWDLPTRAFHWALVAGIGFSWFSAEMGGNWMEWHGRAGTFLLALVLFRIMWGFIGSDTARFTQFVTSPVQALQHWREMKTHQGMAFHAGHNPLGAWMVLGLLAVVLLQASTGLFASDDIDTEGPLLGLVSGGVADVLNIIHHLNFNLILLFAAVHVAAVLFYRFRKQTNLVKAMVLGDADWPVAQAVPQGLRFQSAWQGAMTFVACYALVYFGIQWLAA
jgi:cytochrome b